MKQIKINNRKLGVHYAFVDDDDFDKVNEIKWWLSVGRSGTKYARTRVNKEDISMHVMIMGKGDKPMIDHKDGNGLNNQKENLRFCTNSENQKNKKSKGLSKYLGVCPITTRKKYYRKKTNEWVVHEWFSFHVHININGKSTHVGAFKNEIDAAKAYNKAALLHHKEFANLNTFKKL